MNINDIIQSFTFEPVTPAWVGQTFPLRVDWEVERNSSATWRWAGTLQVTAPQGQSSRALNLNWSFAQESVEGRLTLDMGGGQQFTYKWPIGRPHLIKSQLQTIRYWVARMIELRLMQGNMLFTD